MLEPLRRHRPPDGFPTTRIIAVVLLVANLTLGTVPVRADEPTVSPTTAMLMLFRIDDQLSAQVKGLFGLRCGLYPVEQRELCGTVASEFLRDMEGGQFARLMTPFFDRNFAASEIEMLTEFFASPDGKIFAEVLVLGSYIRMSGEMAKDARPIDKATQDRWNAFLQSGVGKKFSDMLASQFVQERDKQSRWYLCGLLGEERHKMARAIIPIPCST
jgi:hypothetical protein